MYPTLSRPCLGYVLYAASLDVQADIATKRTEFEQVKFHSPGYFPREVFC